jgi:hypothetical protein
MGRMNQAIIFAFCSLPFYANGQSKTSLDIFATPLIQNFFGISDKEHFIDHPNITAEYLYFPKKEFGINYNQTFNNNFGWYAGVSYNTESRSMHLSCYEDSLKRSSQLLVYYSKEIRIQRMAIKGGCNYSFSDKIQIDLGFIVSYNISTKITPEFDFDMYGYYYSPETNLHIQVYELDGLRKMQIIPELKMSFEIFNRFRVHFGTRLKLRGSGYFRTRIEGSYETIDYSENLLHLSGMSGSDFSFFTGLTYRIGIKN